jgi:hypothetical protein
MVCAQHLDALIGTGRTANMEKCFHKFLRVTEILLALPLGELAKIEDF